MEPATQTRTFYVHGMYCRACATLTELELKELGYVEDAAVDLSRRTAQVRGRFNAKTDAELAEELSKSLAPHGYKLSLEKEAWTVRWRDFAFAIPAAAAFLALFVALQRAGVVDLIQSDQVTYATAFVVGLVASVSTCMAVVGGLVLSVSAAFAKQGERLAPQFLFHVGRLLSFFFLGGVIGAVGSIFQLNVIGMFVVTLSVAIVLLLLGISLLEVLPPARKLQLAVPTLGSAQLLGLQRMNHTLTPLLLGVMTFFLPCGFTQAMQFYSLSTGSFWVGAGTMLMFALGTLPVLALLSFGALGFQDRARSSMFFKTVGLIVIFFALFNLMNSLVLVGAFPPLFSL